jgi:hypothetical protein
MDMQMKLRRERWLWNLSWQQALNEYHLAFSTIGWSLTTEITTLQGWAQEVSDKDELDMLILAANGPGPRVPRDGKDNRSDRSQTKKPNNSTDSHSQPFLFWFKCLLYPEVFICEHSADPPMSMDLCVLALSGSLEKTINTFQSVFKWIEINTQRNQWYWNTVVSTDPLGLQGKKDTLYLLGMTVLYGIEP